MRLAALAERRHQGWLIFRAPGPLVDRPVRALWGTVLVAGYLLAAYGAVYELLPGRLSADVYVYVAQPLIWGGLALLAYALWRGLPERPALSKALVGLAVMAGVFQVSLLVILGTLYGFGHSPYGDQALAIAKNFLYLATLLLGLEMSRAYLLRAWSRINAAVAFAAVAVLYAAVSVPLGQYRLLGGETERTFEVTGATILPAASESVMATFLASIGGPLPAFGYRFMVEGFEWFSPILPNLEWPILAFVGALAPVLALLIVRDMYFGAREETAAEPEERGIGVSPVMLVAGMVVVALIWLNAGMFGVQPALVSGMSMKPALGPGDIVFTKEVAPESLEVGDVIRYRGDGVAITHRIIEIPEHIEGAFFQTEDEVLEVQEGDGGLVFITQGDGNNVADAPVVADQIEGKVVYTLRRVGWIPIKIKAAINGMR